MAYLPLLLTRIVSLSMSDPIEDQFAVVKALVGLADLLKDLDDHGSHPISHYRQVPPDLMHAYEILAQAASLIHATATKYTLLGKAGGASQLPLSKELLRGAQLLGTATLLFFEHGASTALRKHVKRAARSIVGSLMSLVEAFLDESAMTDSIGAQKTGVVWSTCDTVLHKKIPVGNRSAMRREWLTFRADCNETIEEFQALLDADPVADGEEGFDEIERYTEDEIPVVSACLALIKCSRGCINVTMQACEALGEARLEWINSVFDLSVAVGVGVTDLGTLMYAPTDRAALVEAARRQARAVLEVVQRILGDDSLPSEVLELASKLQQATSKRLEEALDGESVEQDS